MVMKKDIIIKILSLGLGLAVGIVLVAKIIYEISYDTAYKYSDRIYLISSNFVRGDEASNEFNQVSGGVAPGFKESVPGVESATRVTHVVSSEKFKDEEGNVVTGSSLAADTCFFDVFSQEILIGNPKEILSDPSQVMINESFAKKLGGIQESLGKKIINDDYPDKEFVVGGVYEDFKKNGSLSPDVLISLNIMPEWSRLNWMGNDRYIGYVKLEKNINPESLADPIREMQKTHQDIEKYEKMGIKLWYTINTLSNHHRNLTKIKSAVIILSIMAFLIIAVSLLNYIMIVITGLIRRSREVGIRKCYGADKKSVFLLLLKESSWQLACSLLLTALLIFLGRGLIKDFTDYSFSALLVPESILAIGIVIVIVFLVSVVVPGQIYMRIPVDVALRGYKENSRKWKIGLLGMQIFINVFIFCFVLIVSLQYRKVNNFNPGYSTKDIVFIDYFSQNLSNYLKIKEEIEKLPFVEETGVCPYLPFIGVSGNDTWALGATETEEVFNIVDLYPSTSEIFDILKINFIEGSKPTKEGEIAVSKNYVDKMNKLVNWSDGAIGKQVYVTDHNDMLFTITGVYDDILIGNLLESDIRPSAWPYGSLDNDNNFFNYIVIKTTEMTPEYLTQIKDAAESVLNGQQVDVQLASESVRYSYEESRKIRDVLLIGGIVSLLIALMGLIGFLNDEANRRKKELAIRKINGATTRNIYDIFLTTFIKLSAASGIVACCGAYALGKDWLNQFSEKISLSPMIFLVASIFVVTVICVVILINCYRFVRANPSEALKTE